MGDTPMLSSYAIPVTRLRDSEPQLDQDDQPIPGSGSTSAQPLPDALFAPGNTSEPVVAGTAAVISQPTLYWPSQTDLDIVATDRLVVGGTTYMVEGIPANWPLGTVVTLKAVQAK